MKKRILCFITIFMIISSVVTANDVVVSFKINNSEISVNDEIVKIDAKAVEINGRTLVPVRAVIEAFGGNVVWNESDQSIELYMNNDVIKMRVNEKEAYFNNEKYTLDVPPTVIADRTLLPIRFIAESFNIGVAWNETEQKVILVTNDFDEEEYNYIKTNVLPFSGNPYCVINSNVPMFKNYEIIDASFEFYGKLDELNRCDVCFSSVSKDLMPTQERESISSVKPTGWVNNSYEFVEGSYLYNRCHLLGFQLTGENANPRNLITGTRFLNINGMLPFENMIDDYVEKTNNHVLYRVTPVFTDNNLLADGVLLEGYSVEDKGLGICFCVFCYNVQPGVLIDYRDGSNSSEGSAESKSASVKIYRTPSGKKYHYDMQCGGKNSYEITLEEALKQGLTPCKKCCN